MYLLPLFLLQSPAVQPTIIVSADRIAQPQESALPEIEVIDREQIDAAGVSDLYELLRGRPGLDLTRAGPPGTQSSVFVRGANSNQVLVLIDGVRVAQATTGGAAWELIPLATIGRIEIIRGPRSSIYGSDAIGGVVSIHTRRDDGHELNARAGRYASYSIGGRLAMAGEGGHFALSVEDRRSDGFSAIVDPNVFGFDADSDAMEGQVALVSGGLARDGASLDGHLLASRLKVDFDPNRSVARHDQLGLTMTTAGFAGSRQFVLGHLQLDLEQFPARAEGPRLSRFTTERDSWSLLERIDFEPLDLTLGLDYASEEGAAESGTQVDFRGRRQTTSAFALARGAIRALDYELGLRHDDSSDYGSAWTPQAALRWNYASAGSLRLSVGDGFRAPNYNELYSPGFVFDGSALFAGNPALEPERARSVELGWAGTIGRTMLTAAAYSTEVRDLVSFEGQNFQAINIARAQLDGVDLSAEFSVDRVDIRGWYSWLDARNERTGAALLRRAEHKAGLKLESNVGESQRLGADLEHVAERPDFGTTLAAYTLLHLRWQVQLGDHATLQVRLENATDERYELIDGYGVAGASLSVGLRLGR